MFVDRWAGSEVTETLPGLAPASRNRRALSSTGQGGGQVSGDPLIMNMCNGASWIAPGTEVYVQGRGIRGGLFYFGAGLPSVTGMLPTEPALVDPDLPVAWERPAPNSVGLGTSPSYLGGSPECRSRFLNWLDGDRSDADIHADYVLLYLYGLERRLLFDLAPCSDTRAEAEQAIQELTRLLSVYGASAELSRRVGSFLDVARLRHGGCPAHEHEPPCNWLGLSPRPILAAAVAEFAAKGNPLPTAWAHSIAVCSVDGHVGQVARECPHEFRQLFEVCYARQFGIGMRLDSRDGSCPLIFHPSSPSLPWDVDSGFRVAPLRSTSMLAIGAIAADCAKNLRKFAREQARSVVGPSLRATLALPPDLLARRPEVLALKELVEPLTSTTGMALLEAAEILRVLGQVPSKRCTGSPWRGVARLLSSLGLALEPDALRGRMPRRIVAVFRSQVEPGIGSSAGLEMAALLVRCASFVAWACSEPSPDWRERVMALAERAEGVVAAWRERLRAIALVALSETPPLGVARRAFGRLSTGERESFARAVACVAGSGRRPTPAEVRALARVYHALGLPPASVFADLHAAAAGEETACMRSTETGPSGPGAIDGLAGKASTPLERGSHVDPARLDAVERESAEAARLLAGVFTSDEAPQSMLPATKFGTVGLTASQLTFARDLRAKTTWERGELKSLAARHGLLLDGAIEALNEAAFERCGRPACEGENPVVVDSVVLSEII